MSSKKPFMTKKKRLVDFLEKSNQCQKITIEPNGKIKIDGKSFDPSRAEQHDHPLQMNDGKYFSHSVAIAKNKLNYKAKRNQFIKIECRYYSSEDAVFTPALSIIQKKFGGSQHFLDNAEFGMNLYPYLELAITFIAGATLGEALKNYFAGISGAKKAQKLGAQHRAIILRWFKRIRNNLKYLIDSGVRRIYSGISASFLREEERAIYISFELGEISGYVVINVFHISENALNRLPDDFIRMLKFIAENGQLKGPSSIQLCLDPLSNEWKYLLVPKWQITGRFVGQVMDLSTGRPLKLRSVKDIIKRLGIRKKDRYKFLINLFRDPADFTKRREK